MHSSKSTFLPIYQSRFGLRSGFYFFRSLLRFHHPISCLRMNSFSVTKWISYFIEVTIARFLQNRMPESDKKGVQKSVLIQARNQR
ncbi:MAG: hypothetical protein EA360_07065 [Balneolaceae bacterium]|nr:MAG: hypothetical protein EA360_07065 [Balneolaceae bacterium]